MFLRLLAIEPQNVQASRPMDRTWRTVFLLSLTTLINTPKSPTATNPPMVVDWSVTC